VISTSSRPGREHRRRPRSLVDRAPGTPATPVLPLQPTVYRDTPRCVSGQ